LQMDKVCRLWKLYQLQMTSTMPSLTIISGVYYNKKLGPLQRFTKHFGISRRDKGTSNRLDWALFDLTKQNLIRFERFSEDAAQQLMPLYGSLTSLDIIIKDKLPTLDPVIMLLEVRAAR